MEEKKNRPAFRGRDAAMLGGIAGGLYGTYSPFRDIDYTNELVSNMVYSNPNIPGSWEEPTVMAAGGSTVLTNATLGALAAAGVIKGAKALTKRHIYKKDRAAFRGCIRRGSGLIEPRVYL